MTEQEAKESLSFHSGRNDAIDDPRWENGFLGSLRPYQGALKEENFHDVINCLRTLGPELVSSDIVDREVVNDVMGILHLGRAWGVHEDGMLRSNNLISESDWQTPEAWIETISYTFMMILDTSNDACSYEEYESYLAEKRSAQPDGPPQLPSSLGQSGDH